MLEGITILRNLVVIQPLNQKKKNTVGYAVPEEAGGDVGKVVALGPEVSDLKLDSVIYFGNVTKKVLIKGSEYIVMESDNVIGFEAV